MSELRGVIDTTDAHIGQYDTCSEGVLVLPNIYTTTILVIGNMYRYIEKCLLGTKTPPGADFWLISQGIQGSQTDIFRSFDLFTSRHLILSGNCRIYGLDVFKYHTSHTEI